MSLQAVRLTRVRDAPSGISAGTGPRACAQKEEPASKKVSNTTVSDDACRTNLVGFPSSLRCSMLVLGLDTSIAKVSMYTSVGQSEERIPMSLLQSAGFGC